LEFSYRQTIEGMAAALAGEPSLAALERIHEALAVLPRLPFVVDLWQVQNYYFQLLALHYPRIRARAGNDETAHQWTARFQSLGRLLRVKVAD
jgi:hypothetical protein